MTRNEIGIDIGERDPSAPSSDRSQGARQGEVHDRKAVHGGAPNGVRPSRSELAAKAEAAAVASRTRGSKLSANASKSDAGGQKPRATAGKPPVPGKRDSASAASASSASTSGRGSASRGTVSSGPSEDAELGDMLSRVGTEFVGAIPRFVSARPPSSPGTVRDIASKGAGYNRVAPRNSGGGGGSSSAQRSGTSSKPSAAGPNVGVMAGVEVIMSEDLAAMYREETVAYSWKRASERPSNEPRVVHGSSAPSEAKIRSAGRKPPAKESPKPVPKRVPDESQLAAVAEASDIHVPAVLATVEELRRSFPEFPTGSGSAARGVFGAALAGAPPATGLEEALGRRKQRIDVTQAGSWKILNVCPANLKASDVPAPSRQAIRSWVMDGAPGHWCLLQIDDWSQSHPGMPDIPEGSDVSKLCLCVGLLADGAFERYPATHRTYTRSSGMSAVERAVSEAFGSIPIDTVLQTEARVALTRLDAAAITAEAILRAHLVRELVRIAASCCDETDFAWCDDEWASTVLRGHWDPAQWEGRKQFSDYYIYRLLRAKRRLLAALSSWAQVDHYEILGISKDATDGEIKRAYREKCLVLHPDKGGDKQKFQELQNAYAAVREERKAAKQAGKTEAQAAGSEPAAQATSAQPAPQQQGSSDKTDEKPLGPVAAIGDAPEEEVEAAREVEALHKTVLDEALGLHEHIQTGLSAQAVIMSMGDNPDLHVARDAAQSSLSVCETIGHRAQYFGEHLSEFSAALLANAAENRLVPASAMLEESASQCTYHSGRLADSSKQLVKVARKVRDVLVQLGTVLNMGCDAETAKLTLGLLQQATERAGQRLSHVQSCLASAEQAVADAKGAALEVARQAKRWEHVFKAANEQEPQAAPEPPSTGPTPAQPPPQADPDAAAQDHRLLVELNRQVLDLQRQGVARYREDPNRLPLLTFAEHGQMLGLVADAFADGVAAVQAGTDVERAFAFVRWAKAEIACPLDPRAGMLRSALAVDEQAVFKLWNECQSKVSVRARAKMAGIEVGLPF